MQTTQSTLTP